MLKFKYHVLFHTYSYKPSIRCNFRSEQKNRKFFRNWSGHHTTHTTPMIVVIDEETTTSCAIVNLFRWTTIDLLAALNIWYCLNRITSHSITSHKYSPVRACVRLSLACLRMLRYYAPCAVCSSAISDTFFYSLIRSIILRWLVNKLNFTLRWTLKFDHCHFHQITYGKQIKSIFPNFVILIEGLYRYSLYCVRVNMPSIYCKYALEWDFLLLYTIIPTWQLLSSL